jgi:hypothetical protein
VLLRIASVLAVAYTKSIAHKDVKPSSILSILGRDPWNGPLFRSLWIKLQSPVHKILLCRLRDFIPTWGGSFAARIATFILRSYSNQRLALTLPSVRHHLPKSLAYCSFALVSTVSQSLETFRRSPFTPPEHYLVYAMTYVKLADS